MFKYPLAVTIDTNIFDAAKFNLGDASTLRILENYVRRGKIKVMMLNQSRNAAKTKKAIPPKANFRGLFPVMHSGKI